jgi:hypothetical protein
MALMTFDIFFLKLVMLGKKNLEFCALKMGNWSFCLSKNVLNNTCKKSCLNPCILPFSYSIPRDTYIHTRTYILYIYTNTELPSECMTITYLCLMAQSEDYGNKRHALSSAYLQFSVDFLYAVRHIYIYILNYYLEPTLTSAGLSSMNRRFFVCYVFVNTVYFPLYSEWPYNGKMPFIFICVNGLSIHSL